MISKTWHHPQAVHREGQTAQHPLQCGMAGESYDGGEHRGELLGPLTGELKGASE